MAGKTTKETVNNEVEEVVKTPEPVDVMNTMVTVKLPRSREEKEDVVVWVNDRRFLIQRGVEVTVPLAVKRILDNQEKMLEKIYEFEDKNARD